VLEVPPHTGNGRPPSNILEEVKRLFQRDSSDGAEFSTKFFYKMRDLFALIAPEGRMVMERDVAEKLLVAEYLATREHTWDADWSQDQIRKEAEKRIKRLLALCHARKRDADTGTPGDTQRYSADGALLVRFLSQKEA
jgi:hypothetical protein